MLNKLKAIWAVGAANPYMMAVAGVVVFILAWYAYIYYANLPSENERNLQQLNNQATEQVPVEQQAERKAEGTEVRAKDKEQVADEKVRKAEQVRRANVSNTTYDEANRNRCLAYPEDPGCPK